MCFDIQGTSLSLLRLRKLIFIWVVDTFTSSHLLSRTITKTQKSFKLRSVMFYVERLRIAFAGQNPFKKVFLKSVGFYSTFVKFEFSKS